MKIFEYLLIVLVAFAVNSCNRNIPGKVATTQPNQGSINRPHLVINEETVPDPKIMASLVKHMMDSVEIKDYFPPQYVDNRIFEAFDRFYQQRNFEVAWNDYNQPKKAVDEFFNLLQRSWQHGFNPDDYQVGAIREQLEAAYNFDKIVFAADLVKADFLLTAAFLTYAEHLHSGRINPEEIVEKWESYLEPVDLAGYLEKGLNQENFIDYILKLAPQHEQYSNLRQHLIQLQKIRKEGGWPQISSSEAELEDNEKLVERLLLTRDLDSMDLGKLNRSVVVDALKHFQSRYQIPLSGQLDDTTLLVLQQPVEGLIQKVELNMERFRWYPDNFEGNYITVNVPEFVLRLYNEDQVELAMTVIVGEEFEKHSTPIFSDKMEYIVFSPTWNVPLTIARREFLPILRKNPGDLIDRNMVIYQDWSENAPEVDPHEVEWSEVTKEDFNYKIVQKPGGANALGGMKFIFPNNKSIYLHDTPSEHLFDAEKRDFSHGCIRVSEPVELAEYLLKDQPEWDYAKITEFMHKDEPEWVPLTEDIPVHIMYQTIWVNSDSQMIISEDIYDYDQKQIGYLQEIENSL